MCSLHFGRASLNTGRLIVRILPDHVTTVMSLLSVFFFYLIVFFRFPVDLFNRFLSFPC